MSAHAWLSAAERAGTDFPVANLPYGVFRAADGTAHVGVAIGDQILDLRAAAEVGLLDALAEPLRAACGAASLNALMGLEPGLVHALRARLQTLLTAGDTRERERATAVLTPQDGSVMLLPAVIGDYTDFYASIHHARNVGSLFRPANPLLPNYQYVPVGYHGRASSVVVSPREIQRPNGQSGREGQPPTCGPTRQLDYELEVGAFVGCGNRLGEPIRLAEAGEHVFGLCLLNDWSARDIQRWEYQPLGPFLGKNFATSISPWVVTWAALEPYREPRVGRGAGEPEPLAYLDDAGDRKQGGINVTLEVWLTTARMREEKMEAVRVSRSNLRNLYWTLGQMVTHHTVNGCNLRPGDLLGTGTVSGPEPEARGCLLELTEGGKKPLMLPSGESRTFLENGDEVALRGYCEREGQVRIGFGECRGRVVPALRV